MSDVILEDLGGEKILVGINVGPTVTPNIPGGPPEVNKAIFDNLPNLKVRKDDIMLCTYQKTGTNWLYEIISMINSRSAERVTSHKISTMIECVPEEMLEKSPSPRVLNSHLRPCFLPTGLRDFQIKTVVCFRNPKDTAVSFYNHMKGLKLYRYNGKFADWLPIYLEGKFEYGKYTDYLKEWEKLIKEGPGFPLHVMYFENLKVDGAKELDKLLKFLEVELDDKLKSDILDACGFEKMAAEKTRHVPKEVAEKILQPGFNFYRKDVILEDLGGEKILVGINVGPTVTPNIARGPPEVNKAIFDNLPNLKLRKDDIMLCTYQKTGTNWLYEIISMINSRSAERVTSHKVSTMIECVPEDMLENSPSPRVLNSHLRPSFLPTGLRDFQIKTVVCFRNPKDTAVSFYNHVKGLKLYGYNGKFADWLPIYLEGKFEYGKYTDYLKEWEKLIKEGPGFPLHVMYFENLKVDGAKELDKLLKFLEVDLDDKLKSGILDACGFEKMAAEKTRQVPKEVSEKIFQPGFNFYRKGEIGDWKNWLTVAQNETFDNLWATEMKDSNMFNFIYTDPRSDTK